MPYPIFRLDDIEICIYAIGDEKEDECAPEALQALYEISSFLGVKIRYSTLSSFANYVRTLTMLTDFEKEQLIDLLKLLIVSYRRYDYEEAKMVAQKIFKIVIGTQIEVESAKDAIEIALNAVYASIATSIESTSYEPIEKDAAINIIKIQEVNTAA
ncbi:MAG: hypothetical protein QXT53_02460 [Ignisphaera sp.]